MSGSGSAVPESVRPVTRGRVEETLAREGYRFSVDQDGAIGGTWEGDRFTITLVGEAHTVLQVRGTWSRTLDAELAPGIAQVVNDWNRDRIWPKVYTRGHGQLLRVQTELSVDLTDGATDAQVAEVLACGLGTGVQFFRTLADLVPEEPTRGDDFGGP